jgi:hypothetical protein
MGEYITLKFEAELTDAGRAVVSSLKLQQEDSDPWQLAIDAAPDIFPARQVARYLIDYRRNFIPFGVLGQPPRHMADLWCKNVNRLTEHTWKVVCAVKTRSTIDHFLADILPYMLEAECTAKTWEEENDEPATQHIKPGRPQ